VRKVWIIVGFAIVLATVWAFAFTGTPLSGHRLILKDIPVASIELSMSTRHETTESNTCAKVLQTMRKARDGGPVHLCTSLGSLMIRYADGTTNRFDLMPGHRFNRLDMVDTSGHSGMYSISMREMFGTLESVGLKEK
jgi:hypothetical protein